MSICPVCNKSFKSEKGLAVHKPFCNETKERKFVCEFCDKTLSTKYSLTSHLQGCKKKELIEEKVVTMKKSDDNEKTILGLIAELKIANNRIIDLERENKNLLKSLEDANKNVHMLAQKSGTTTYNQINTNNNITNYLQPITNEDYERISIELVHDHDIINEKQFARFCLQNGLKNKVIKTDHSRKVITYVDEQGNQIKDPKAKELTESIYKSTKTVFQEKAKQYEKFNDEQDQDRIDFYNSIVSVNKHSMEKFGDEIVKEASKSVKSNINTIFKELKEEVLKGACYVFSQAAFGIGEWIREKIRDKVIFCRSNVSIKKKYITIRETNEKIENKDLKEGLIYSLDIENFHTLILSLISEYATSVDEIKEITKSINIVYNKLIVEKDQNEWDNIIIGLCG